nr:hypothetical protein [Salmonella sp.]
MERELIVGTCQCYSVMQPAQKVVVGVVFNKEGNMAANAAIAGEGHPLQAGCKSLTVMWLFPSPYKKFPASSFQSQNLV